MSILSRRRAVVGLAAATALIIGIGAAPAGASAILSSHLSVTVLANNDYRLTVTGHVEMSPADATTACAQPGDPVRVELWGQDSGLNGADDLLIGKIEFDAAAMTCTVVSNGLNFSVQLIRDGDVLNEDYGEDEIYAYVSRY